MMAIARLDEARTSQQADVTRFVVITVCGVLKAERDNIRADSTLFELGAQSLDFVEIVTCLEDHYGVDIDDRLAIPGEQTIGRLADALLLALA